MQDKKSGKLNLNKSKNSEGRPEPGMTPEQAQVHFYNTMANCVIDMSISLHKTCEIEQEKLIELTDIKDNLNRMGLKDGWITEVDIAEREAATDPDEDDKEPTA